jgi:hypothetical protein
VNQLDFVAREVRLDALDLELAHRVFARQQFRDGEIFFERDGEPVELALAITRQKERGLTQRLRRERAGVDGGAARLGSALDDRDALSEVRGLRRAFLARRAATEHDEIEIEFHGVFSIVIWASRSRRPNRR